MPRGLRLYFSAIAWCFYVVYKFLTVTYLRALRLMFKLSWKVETWAWVLLFLHGVSHAYVCMVRVAIKLLLQTSMLCGFVNQLWFADWNFFHYCLCTLIFEVQSFTLIVKMLLWMYLVIGSNVLSLSYMWHVPKDIRLTNEAVSGHMLEIIKFDDWTMWFWKCDI